MCIKFKFCSVKQANQIGRAVNAKPSGDTSPKYLLPG